MPPNVHRPLLVGFERLFSCDVFSIGLLFLSCQPYTA
nr:MAG TPA: hypothetical protein [Caudoviricetes sp.]